MADKVVEQQYYTIKDKKVRNTVNEQKERSISPVTLFMHLVAFWGLPFGLFPIFNISSSPFLCFPETYFRSRVLMIGL